MKKIEKIKQEISNLRQIIKKLENEVIFNGNDNLRLQYEKSMKKYFELSDILEDLEALELIKNKKYYVSDGEIDLYLFNYDLESGGRFCKIFLHDSTTYVGQIGYQGNFGYTSFCNISYSIVKDFQGNNYALKALKLITDKIYEDGIDKVYIAAHDCNIPSIKTIEKFGGTLVENHGHISSYECDLSIIKRNNISKK